MPIFFSIFSRHLSTIHRSLNPTTPIVLLHLRNRRRPLVGIMAGKRKLSTVAKAEVTVQTTAAPVTPKKAAPTKRQKKVRDADDDSPLTSADGDMSTAAPTPSASVRRSARARKTTTVTYADHSDSDHDHKMSADSPKAVEDWQAEDEPEHEYDEDEEDLPKAKRQRKARPKTPKTKATRKTKASPAKAEADPTGDVDGQATPVKTPRKRKPKVIEPIVYDIPDVERKETTFKGWLSRVV